MRERPPSTRETVALADAVLPLNLQFELQDYVEAPGAPGMVLTSQGPGLAPAWTSLQSVPATSRGYAFQQLFASDHWEIEHKLLWRPLVSVTNDAGEELVAAVSHPSPGWTFLDFNWPVTGMAWLV